MPPMDSNGLRVKRSGRRRTGGHATRNAGGGRRRSPPARSRPAACEQRQAAAAAGRRTVNIAINPWVGYEANAAVVGYLLAKRARLHRRREEPADEQVSWQGFATGEVDVDPRELGPRRPRQEVHRPTTRSPSDAGPTGNNGIIGWYVPPWMADEYPDITDWHNLNKYADLFKTSESGDKGQFLDGDPSFVTNDEALITNLGLNYKVVYAGSEAALIEALPARPSTEQDAAASATSTSRSGSSPRSSSSRSSCRRTRRAATPT